MGRIDSLPIRSPSRYSSFYIYFGFHQDVPLYLIPPLSEVRRSSLAVTVMLLEYFVVAALWWLHVHADLTIIIGSTTSTAVKCTTRIATTQAKNPIPTTTSTITLSPAVILILAVSTPVKTATNPVSTTTSTVPLPLQ